MLLEYEFITLVLSCDSVIGSIYCHNDPFSFFFSVFLLAIFSAFSSSETLQYSSVCISVIRETVLSKAKSSSSPVKMLALECSEPCDDTTWIRIIIYFPVRVTVRAYIRFPSSEFRKNTEFTEFHRKCYLWWRKKKSKYRKYSKTGIKTKQKPINRMSVFTHASVAMFYILQLLVILFCTCHRRS